MASGTNHETDDELWARSQWDDLAAYEDFECKYHHFRLAVQLLLMELNNGRVVVSTDSDILSMKNRHDKSWSRYVDPAASASNGTAAGTAIFLYECIDHQFTLKLFNGAWVPFRGHDLRDMVDLMQPDPEEAAGAPIDDVHDEDALADDEDLEGRLTAEQIKEIADEDLRSSFDSSTLTDALNEINKTLEQIFSHIEELRDENQQLKRRIDDLS